MLPLHGMVLPMLHGLRARVNNTEMVGLRIEFQTADQKKFNDLSRRANYSLFSYVHHNPSHVLSFLLPPIKNVTYSLHPRANNRESPRAHTLTRCGLLRKCYSTDFIAYLSSYIFPYTSVHTITCNH